MNHLPHYKNEWFNFVDYTPHDGQLQLHTAPENVRFIVACCGRRFGKSYSAAREAELVLSQPNKMIWIVSPNYNTSEKIFRIVYDDMVVKKGYKPSTFSRKEQVLSFDWGSTICGKSAEHPSSLIGEGCDLVIVDEAAKINNFQRIWEMYVRPTLSDKKGKAIFISTPDGYGYFYDLFLRGKTDENWFSFNSPSWDNKFAFPEGKNDPDLLEAKRSLSLEVFEQEYGAKFTSLSGRVYNDFDRDLHVGNFPYVYNRHLYISVDFGYRMPGVIFFQTAVVNGQDHIFIIDEIIHKTNIKIGELCDMITSKPYSISRAFGDPAGYQIQSSVGIGEAEIFARMTGHRIFALRDKASRNINSGISHVRNFIKSSTGVVRLHIDQRCTGIIEDLESYRYPENKENKELKDAPLKDGVHDHGCDALRYGIINKFPIRNFKIRTDKR